MNKKIAFLTCLLAIFGMKLSAQDNMHYGMFLGGNINIMNIDNAFYYDDTEPFTNINVNPPQAWFLTVHDASVKCNGGFMIGGFFEYEISKNLGLQFELMYNQTGYKLKGYVEQPSYSGIIDTLGYKSNLKMSNVSLAVLLRYHVLPNRLSIDLGVQPSYCFRMIKEAERGIYHKSWVYDDKNEFNSLNLCLTGGATVYFFENFFFSARYSLGLIDILKVRTPYVILHEGNYSDVMYRYSDAKSTTSSVQLTVGFKIQ